jgi:hypothetical protein
MYVFVLDESRQIEQPNFIHVTTDDFSMDNQAFCFRNRVGRYEAPKAPRPLSSK